VVDVVTGASGHVGANLVRALLARGRRVRALVNAESRALEGLDVERVSGDVRNPESLRRAFDGAEVVYHLAARISISGDRDGLVRAVNVDGVRNVARAALASRVRRLVHCSSIHAFRLDLTGRPLDESTPKADHEGSAAYDRSKAAGEKELRRAIDGGLDAVIVNPTGILGPFDFGPSRMGRVLLLLRNRKMPALVSGGFNWVDVRDVVDGLLRAFDRGRTGENYILPGHWHPMSELATIAAECTGSVAPRLVVPMLLARASAPWASLLDAVTGKDPLFTTEGLAALRANREIDGSKAARELGYSARPIREAVAAAYQWFDSHEAGRPFTDHERSESGL
jgi:dihydroflavonol-4-reductase